MPCEANGPLPPVIWNCKSRLLLLYISRLCHKTWFRRLTLFLIPSGSVFDKILKCLVVHQKRKDKARVFSLKIVNALTAKLEIGGPMASLYLLGSWSLYWTRTLLCSTGKIMLQSFESLETGHNVPSDRCSSKKCWWWIFWMSPVDDYMYRPYELKWQVFVWMDSNLYRVKCNQSRTEKISE